MLTIEIGPELEGQLECLAKENGQTKESYAERALKELLEDREDYLLGIAALKLDDESTPIAEIRKELGLEN